MASSMSGSEADKMFAAYRKKYKDSYVKAEENFVRDWKKKYGNSMDAAGTAQSAILRNTEANYDKAVRNNKRAALAKRSSGMSK